MTHFVVAFTESDIPRLIESINQYTEWYSLEIISASYQYVGICHDCYQVVVAYKGVRPNGRR
jgi:hypothetical protein|nr:MAG TPA_asm: Manganese responsive transcriptional regulator member, ferric uptake regulator, apo [Caudoviricetes sp.]